MTGSAARTLDGLIEVGAEARGQVGVAADDGADRLSQPMPIQCPGNGDVQLHGVDVLGPG